MDTTVVKFNVIGARARLAPRAFLRAGPAEGRRPRGLEQVRLDVRRDRKGEYFDIAAPSGVTFEILDLRPNDRHLLLLARDGHEKARFLCGHDERHWFIAAVPETAPVTTVDQAMEALKPQIVIDAARRVKRKDRNRRRNDAYVRQGEWFFVPAPTFEPGPRDVILRHEPIMRTHGSKPHVADQAVRTGGETVYVLSGPPRGSAELAAKVRDRFPRGLTQSQYEGLLRESPEARNLPLLPMVRDPDLYVRGSVRHPDHATIRLKVWHRVLMNTEAQARARRHVAFLD